MKEINNLLNSLNIKPLKYQKKGNIFIIETKDNKYVIKKTNKNIYEYLISRDYNFLPNIVYLDNYLIYNYEEEIDYPQEEKILDMIYLVSLLHKKTAYQKNITENDLKEIYESIVGNINFLKIYYDTLMTNIESKEIMNPSEYYLARNISLIYLTLERISKDINNWYRNNKTKESMRYTLIHGNLNINHIINKHLISFEHAKEDLPIYDLYKLYKSTYNKIDWYDLYLKYNKEFKLISSEEQLLFIMLLLPNKIEFKTSEYNNTLLVEKEIEYLNITNDFINKISLPKDTKQEDKEHNYK